MMNSLKIRLFVYSCMLFPCLSLAQTTVSSENLGDKLSMTSNCKPGEGTVCTVNAKNAEEFFTFAKSCDQLAGWQIIFHFGPAYRLSMTADPAGFCTFTMENSNTSPPSTHQCTFTKDLIHQLTSDDAMAIYKQYDATGQPFSAETMQTVLKPLQDCADKFKVKPYIAPIFMNAPPLTTNTNPQ